MKLNINILILLISSLLIMSCEESINNNKIITEIEFENEIDISDWNEVSHGKGAKVDYDIVFPQDAVNRIDIKISSANWQVMMDDMTNKYGGFGSNAVGPPSESAVNPIYVPCSLYFNDIQWYQVGIRFKGNSSLKTSWQNGIYKLPLRLNFDKFEDEYPQINNQRFYGFKELALSSNFDDQSFLREKMCPEIFRNFGVAAPQTAFYVVYIDTGNGPVYFGLYTMVEVVEDTMIETQFGDDNGNIYKPEGIGAAFAKNSFNMADFEKKNNEESEWSDIELLYSVLHSESRLNNSAEWRASLEQVFNADSFIKWLAVNTTIQNWDSYGKMTHNYYLYANSIDNRLTWIPWDNNESLQTGKQGGAISISCSEVSSNWPLIRYLLDDEVYLDKYKNYLKLNIESAFSPSRMTLKYQSYGNLIREYVVGENGEQKDYSFLRTDSDFDSAISTLISHVSDRYNAVHNFID